VRTSHCLIVNLLLLSRWRTLVLSTRRRATLRRLASAVLLLQLAAVILMRCAPVGIVHLSDFARFWAFPFVIPALWWAISALRRRSAIAWRWAFLSITGRRLLSRRRAIFATRRRTAVSWRRRAIARAIGTVRIINAGAQRGGEPHKREAGKRTFHCDTHQQELPFHGQFRPERHQEAMRSTLGRLRAAEAVTRPSAMQHDPGVYDHAPPRLSHHGIGDGVIR
jgi:hypothetical protein